MAIAKLFHLKPVLALRETVDVFFLLLRFLTIAGGVLWYFFIPHHYGTAEQTIFIWILILYTAYSVVLYAIIFGWPDRIRSLYLITLIFDLVFVFTLVRFVDQLRGSFFIAFYLLVAVHSFYFGLRFALLTAAFSTLLYSYIYFDLPGLSPLPWPDFLLRITFLFLISLSMGLLAEREKQTRKKIEELNRDLARKNSILEQTYRHLSIGKLIGAIAEGINGPCGVMSMRSELLMYEAREKGLPGAFLKGLEIIHKYSLQVAQVIRSLLTFSKQKGFEMQPLDFNQLVTDTILLMERELKEKQIVLERKFFADLPVVVGDAYELKGVLINLINNAIDALPRGGKIIITTTTEVRNGPEVICAISDNGRGISEEHLDKIFNPFFTTKNGKEGIGLGLSMSLAVMHKHNGLITVKSKPDEGSTFFLSLPRCGSSAG